MSKNLLFQYFYNSNGDLDPFTKLTDCFNVHLYFTLKSKVNYNGSPYEIFLRDPSFCLTQKKDGSIYDIDFLDNTLNEDVFQIQHHKGKGEATFNEVEALLDKGETVIVYTDTRKVSFFNDNQGEGTEASDAGVVLGHVFLFVHREGEKLYYVEAPWNLNLNNFVPYEKNKSIGVIEKSKLQDAFDSFLTYTTVNINKEGLSKGLSKIKKIANSATENYKREAHEKGDLKYSYGIEAIDGIAEAFSKEIMYLDRKADSCPLNVFSLLDWRIVNIIRRRILLQESVAIYKEKVGQKETEFLISASSADIKSWQNLLTTIRKLNIKKKYLLDSGINKYVFEIGKMEQQLIEELENVGRKIM
jgi:hypothetical protein